MKIIKGLFGGLLNEGECPNMKKMLRLGDEYEDLKRRYFEWLETSEVHLNLYDFAVMYEDTILVKSLAGGAEQ